MPPPPLQPTASVATAVATHSDCCRALVHPMRVQCTATPSRALSTLSLVLPGLDSSFQRWRSQTLQQLQVSILRTYLQLHSLHWPQQPCLRSLRDSDGIRPGWDRGPLLRYVKDNVGGPDPPNGPEHQARGSPRDLGPSRHLPQLMRAHHPSFHKPRRSGAHCSPGIKFRET